MKAILILTWVLAQPSYDGGTAVHSSRVEFTTMARCEVAAKQMRLEAMRLDGESQRRPHVHLSAICVEA